MGFTVLFRVVKQGLLNVDIWAKTTKKRVKQEFHTPLPANINKL